VAPAGETPVAELVEDEVVHIDPAASLNEVARLLDTANIGAVVLGDKSLVTGIVSERDLVNALAHDRDPARTRAADVAQTNLIWCDSEATVAEVAKEMMERYVRHVLVEEDGTLIGIVSARDLLGLYASDEVETE
jgi:CBS domain-containing protein